MQKKSKAKKKTRKLTLTERVKLLEADMQELRERLYDSKGEKGEKGDKGPGVVESVKEFFTG